MHPARARCSESSIDALQGDYPVSRLSDHTMVGNTGTESPVADIELEEMLRARDIDCSLSHNVVIVAARKKPKYELPTTIAFSILIKKKTVSLLTGCL